MKVTGAFTLNTVTRGQCYDKDRTSQPNSWLCCHYDSALVSVWLWKITELFWLSFMKCALLWVMLECVCEVTATFFQLITMLHATCDCDCHDLYSIIMG